MAPDAGLVAAVDLSTIGHWLGIVLKVAIGLGAVIFVHELGHFLVAKACGVKCDKFFLGFDIGGYKISRKWGETEYGIGILPLGGYVKMLGQDDDPSHIAEQMKKSQIDASNAGAVPIVGPNGETYYVDRRSYLAKSIPQRMAIISAGVIMNVIFAFIFAVIAYGMGVPYMPCIVSETVPGSPAWKADIKPGDEIVQIDDIQNPSFNQLRGGVTLGDLENGIPTVVRRAADGQEESILLKPEQGRGLATIGIISPRSLTLAKGFPAGADSPAARAKLMTPAVDDIAAGEAKFEGGDTIVRIGDVPVADYRQFAAALAGQPGQPLLVTVKRPLEKQLKKNEIATPAASGDGQSLTFEVPTQPMRGFGLVMTMGPIFAIQANSPAAAAGLSVGDSIELVDGKPMAGVGGSFDSWDATTLSAYLRDAAIDGREVELTASRTTNDGNPIEQVTVLITPRVPIQLESLLPPRAPAAADALGIAYEVDPLVVAVVPNSPAASAKVQPGDKLISARFILPDDVKDAGSAESITLEPDGANWPMLLDALQRTPLGTEIEFTFERNGASDPILAKLKPQELDGVFLAERGFFFQPIERIRKADTFAQQLKYGWDETVESLTMVYRFLRKIGTQVPLTALGGPWTIAKAAGYSASEGLSTLLVFLTMLSANLAVINFLPIPLLDGGHMVFLAYEAIRGRPANEKFAVAMHTAGFVFIVSLMLFVFALDLNLIPRNL